MKVRRILPVALGALFALTLLVSARPASAGVKLEVAEDYFVTLSYLLQPHMQLTHNPNGAATLNSDWYLRRSRILLGGQVSKWVSFFMETDSPNWGKGGNYAADSFFVQDAWVKFNIHEAFNIHMGMILPPFIRHYRQSAVSLATLDYHLGLNKYPNHKVWRDVGIEFGGLLMNQRIDWRLSIANGSNTHADDIPRFTGRVAYNFLDAEPDYFFGGTYLGRRRIFSVGVAFDVQPINTGTNDITYFGIGADVAWDLPFVGGNRLSGQLNFAYYGDKDYANAGMGILFDTGYAIGQWQPGIMLTWFKPEGADDFDAQYLRASLGLTYWLQGHNANIKLDVALDKTAGLAFGDAPIVTTLQTQLFF